MTTVEWLAARQVHVGKLHAWCKDVFGVRRAVEHCMRGALWQCCGSCSCATPPDIGALHACRTTTTRLCVCSGLYVDCVAYVICMTRDVHCISACGACCTACEHLQPTCLAPTDYMRSHPRNTCVARVLELKMCTLSPHLCSIGIH